jgi:putative membrane protein
MKKADKCLSVFLAAAMLASAAPVTAGAAAPAVSADETAYVSLDYYGKTEDINVVKRYSLNGNRQVVDHGSYGDILNMSNEVKPAVSGDTVTWNLPSGLQDFYCQYTPSDTNLTLPWSFDVSYKLNGAPAKADKLAGASGLVEITVKATPNTNASDYMKNNMLLEVGTAFKMKDTYSLEAPGAQVQTLGEYKAVIFAAVPGEEEEFTIRIGTRSFDTTGIVMMMQPGTLSDFSDIKELKSDKDTVKDSLDAIHDSADSVLDTLAGMTGGITGLKSGLNAADEARKSISGGKGSVYKNADAAIADLADTSKELADLVPHLKKGQDAINDVNADINALNKTITESGNDMHALSNHISKFTDAVDDLRDAVDDLGSTAESSGSKAKSLAETMKDGADDISADEKVLQAAAAQLEGQISKLQTASALLNTVLADKTVQQALVNELAAKIKQEYANISDEDANKQAAAILTSNLSDMQTYETSVSELIKFAKEESSSIGQLNGNTAEILTSAASLISELDSAFDALEDSSDAADTALKNASRLGSDMQGLLETCRKATTNIDSLNTTANKYKDGAVDALQDAAELTSAIAGGIGSAQSFLSSLESLFKSSGSKLDTAAKSSLSGAVEVLQKSLDGISKTDTIKDAGNTINETVNDEIDKYENDNNLLNLDCEAKPVSLTSSANPSPSSVQIVLRTKEITTEDNSQKIKDQEAAEATVSPLERIKNIFAKIGAAFKSIFSGS